MVHNSKYFGKAPEWAKIPRAYYEDPTPFRYYGLDVCPESIDHVAKRYRDIENAKFICAGLSDGVYTNKDFSWDPWANFDWHHLDIKTNTIYIFFSLPMLLELLKIDHLDILALDIDGYEHFVLNDIHNWKILPDLICCELHGLRTPEVDRPNYAQHSHELFPALLELLKSFGYELIYKCEPEGKLVYIHMSRIHR